MLALFDDRRVRRRTLFYNRVPVGPDPDPTAQQLIPASLAEEERRGAGQRAAAVQDYEYEPDEEEILAELLPRNVGGAGLSARCWRTPPPSRARA